MLPLGSAKLLTAVSSFAEPSDNFWEGVSWNPRSNVFQLAKTLASTYRVDSFTPLSRLLRLNQPYLQVSPKQLITLILLIRNRGHNSTQLLPFLHNYLLHIKVFFEKSLKVSSFSENYHLTPLIHCDIQKNETFDIFYRKVSSKYHKIARSIINFGFESI